MNIRVCFLLCLALLAAGCGPIVPATTPPQLNHTSGPAFVVTDRMYANDIFSVRYPAGWRIVTGQAHLPPHVVIVSPDERAQITLIVGTLDDANFGTQGRMATLRGVTLSDGTLLTITGEAPAEMWNNFLPVFDAVVRSLSVSIQ